ncbi:MAG: hypothetical protein GWP10_20075, partial [Nitrospiraceae bacterium]|nr:hypothetical protein [Nitrospiraceae bacterium]
MKKISVSVVAFLCVTFFSGMSFGQGLPQVHTKIDIKKIDLGHFSREQGPKSSRGLTSEKQVRDL